jgi:hypothetical protein
MTMHDLWVVEHRCIHSLPVMQIGESEKQRLHDAHEALHDRWFTSTCKDKRNCAFAGGWHPGANLLLGIDNA